MVVGSVSATGQNSDLQMTNDTDTVSTGNDAVTSVSDSSDVLEATGTFTQLQTLINQNYNKTLTLTNDYSYDESFGTTEGITIEDSITIDGQGKYTINGKGLSRLFIVTGHNVTLKNIKFINGLTSNLIENNAGGAIRWAGDNGTILNSYFENNIAPAGAGAIYWYGSCGTISNSKFYRNNASTSGGAICWYANNGTITNTIFENNNASGGNGGGVQWRSSDSTIRNCTFYNNYAGTGSGGIVIESCTRVNMSLCNFKANHVPHETIGHYGGALWFNEATYCTVSDSVFENNIAPSGGAIYWNDASIYGVLTNCTFKNNTATSYYDLVEGDGRSGGAIEWGGMYGTVRNCSFIGNKNLNCSGGAIWFRSTSALLDSCRFINNSAVGNGGAIHLHSRDHGLTIENSYFEGNSAENGGAISSITDYNSVVNCTFHKNTASGNGGGVYSNSDGLNLVDSTFTSNTASQGNAIYIETGHTVFFQNNDATQSDMSLSGVTVLLPYVYISPDGKGDGSTINSPTNWTYAYANVGLDGIIYFKSGTYTDIVSKTIAKTINLIGVGDVTIDLQQQGRAFTIANTYTVTITNIDFKNGKLTATGSNNGWGGAINNGGTLTLDTCNFINNSVTGTGTDGGAIQNSGTLTIVNCSFVNNSANWVGGAIHTNALNSIYDSNFTNNSVSADPSHGGAIYIYGGLIDNCRFVNNKAVTTGGAISAQSADLEIKDCYFESNEATNGSAIGQNKVKSNFDISGSTFTKNDASDTGTIYLVDGGELSIESSTFTNNEVGSDGEEISSSGTITPEVVYVKQGTSGSGFYESDPTNWDTALSKVDTGGKIILLGTFTDIVAKTINKAVTVVGSGSTVLNGGGTKRFFTVTASGVTIENIAFNNGKGDNGGAISWSGANGNLINCIFTNNVATGNGGAVYWTGTGGKIDKSTFETTASKNPLYTTQSVTVTNSVLQNQFTLTKTGDISYGVDEVITGTFASNAPSSVYIYLNDVNKGSVSVSSNTFSKSFSLLPVGYYTISIKDNKNNNYTFTSSTSFTVSRIATVYISPSGTGSGASSSSPTTWDKIADIITDDGTIIFADGNYDLYGKSISKAWTLKGSSASNVIINGNGQTNIFSIDTTNVKIYNLTLINAGQPITGENVVTVKDSVLENQISLEIADNSLTYGDTLTLTGSFYDVTGKISSSTISAYNGNTLIATSSGSTASYSITRNGNLAVGSYTLSATKKSLKRRII